MAMTFKEMSEWIKTGDATPPWFKAGSTTPKFHIRNVRLGLHPFGDRLTTEENATCGNCRFHTVHTWGDTYHKCSLMAGTHGPGTDLRVKWHGCEKWEKG